MSLSIPKNGYRLSALQELRLSPQARRLFHHMNKLPRKSISAREAVFDLDITSATLTRRICDLKDAGVLIRAERLTHPVSGKRYTRYHLEGTDPDYGLRNTRRS